MEMPIVDTKNLRYTPPPEEWGRRVFGDIFQKFSMHDKKKMKVIVVGVAALLMCHFAYGQTWDVGLVPDRCVPSGGLKSYVQVDTVHKFFLAPNHVQEILAKEFGADLFTSRPIEVSSVNYEVTRNQVTKVEAGQFEVTFSDEKAAKKLFDRASKRGHFYTRKIARSYSVRRNKGVVVIFYADSAPSIMECSEVCDIECLVSSLSAVMATALQPPGSAPAATAPPGE